jgi:hypothetical protein
MAGSTEQDVTMTSSCIVPRTHTHTGIKYSVPFGRLPPCQMSVVVVVVVIMSHVACQACHGLSDTVSNQLSHSQPEPPTTIYPESTCKIVTRTRILQILRASIKVNHSVREDSTCGTVPFTDLSFQFQRYSTVIAYFCFSV